MHTEILNKVQSELLPVVSHFSKDFYLVGGTAIALYLGHRASIDFDNEEELKIDIMETDKFIKPQVNIDGIRFAHIEDIAAMKLEAITSRNTKKDFYDIAELLKT